MPGAAIGRRKFGHENHVPHDERGPAGCWLHGILQCHGGLLYAVNFARERIQGRDLADGRNAEAPSVPIIRHPDVRRMLLWMKSHVEGMRSFIYYVARCFDLAECSADEKERERNDDLSPCSHH
jgi:alkylation response protein AidB-like acyl-CoA dehydrogenase